MPLVSEAGLESLKTKEAKLGNEKRARMIELTAVSGAFAAGDMARKMVTAWGMSEKLGPMAYGKNQENVFMGRDFGHQRDYSEQIAYEIDEEIKSIVEERYELAKRLLNENRDMLEAISKELLDKETIDEKEFQEIMDKVRNSRNFS